MTRTLFGVLLLAAAPAFAQADPPKLVWDVDAKLSAVDTQLAEFPKLGFDPKSPAPDGTLPELRKRTEAATRALDAVRLELAKLQAAAQAEVDTKAKALNEEVRRFRAANTVVASHLHFLDKVAASPTKAMLESNREGYAKDWETRYGQDVKRLAGMEEPIQQAIKPYLAEAQKAGYSGVGPANPFAGPYSASFYDDTGNVSPAVWNAGMEAWKRYQADAKATADRLRRQAAEIETKAQALDKKFTEYEATTKAVARVVGPASDKVNRADLVGTWKGETVQGANKIGVTLVIEADGRISNTAENGLSGKGTWARSGDKLQVRWSTGAMVTWTIKDGKLSGGGTSGKGEKWSVEFTKQ